MTGEGKELRDIGRRQAFLLAAGTLFFNGCGTKKPRTSSVSTFVYPMKAGFYATEIEPHLASWKAPGGGQELVAWLDKTAPYIGKPRCPRSFNLDSQQLFQDFRGSVTKVLFDKSAASKARRQAIADAVHVVMLCFALPYDRKYCPEAELTMYGFWDHLCDGSRWIENILDSTIDPAGKDLEFGFGEANRRLDPSVVKRLHEELGKVPPSRDPEIDAALANLKSLVEDVTKSDQGLELVMCLS